MGTSNANGTSQRFSHLRNAEIVKRTPETHPDYTLLVAKHAELHDQSQYVFFPRTKTAAAVSCPQQVEKECHSARLDKATYPLLHLQRR